MAASIDSITTGAAVIIALGLATAALFKSLSGYIDAKTALLRTEKLTEQNRGQENRIASLENGGTTRLVKETLVELGLLAKRTPKPKPLDYDDEYFIPEHVAKRNPRRPRVADSEEGDSNE